MQDRSPLIARKRDFLVKLEKSAGFPLSLASSPWREPSAVESKRQSPWTQSYLKLVSLWKQFIYFPFVLK